MSTIHSSLLEFSHSDLPFAQEQLFLMQPNISVSLQQLGTRYKSVIGVFLAASVTMLFVASPGHVIICPSISYRFKDR